MSDIARFISATAPGIIVGALMVNHSSGIHCAWSYVAGAISVCISLAVTKGWRRGLTGA